MSLKELPVVPELTSDNVRTAYASELAAVATPEQLWEFAKRWRPLYLLSRKQKIDKKAKDAKRFRITQNNMQRLISMDWKPSEALECIRVSRAGPCKHATQFSCVGAHIILPPVLLMAELISQKYGVTTDLALIQMSGGLERLDGPG
jgi:hypothetical protein